jgi:hypothetical protein
VCVSCEVAAEAKVYVVRRIQYSAAFVSTYGACTLGVP